MHVAEAGPADGPAVVLCHGFPECWYSWRHQLQRPRRRRVPRARARPAWLRHHRHAARGRRVHAAAPGRRHRRSARRVRDRHGRRRRARLGRPGGVALRVAPPGSVPRRRRPQRPLRGRRSQCRRRGSSPPTPCAPRSATGSSTSSTSRSPGWPSASSTPTSAARSAAILYGISGDVPRDQYRFFDPSARSFFDVAARARRVRSTGCRMPTSTCSSSRSRTTARSPAASTGTATSTATRSCSPRSRAARSSSRRCSSAPSSTRSSVRRRRRCSHPRAVPEPAGPGVDRGLGPLDPAGGARAGQRGAAGVPALVAGLGSSSTLTASAVRRERAARPTPASATACSTSSTLVGLHVGVEVLLEADVEVAAALEREPRHRRGHEVAAPHRHRPRQVGALEHVEVGEQRVGRGRQPEGDAAGRGPTCPTRRRSRASPSSPPAGGRRGGT